MKIIPLDEKRMWEIRAGHRDSATSLFWQHGRCAAESAGRFNSAPLDYGGNLDNKDLVAAPRSIFRARPARF